jgi:hypothetical protein
MSKDVDKLWQVCGSKLKVGGKRGDLFKRRFYMIVGIMCLAHKGYPKVTLGIFEERSITSGDGF